MKLNALLIVSVALLTILAGCVQQEETGTATGTILVTLTDAFEDSNIESLSITIDSLEIQGPESGWISLSKEEKTYNLLELVGVQTVLAEKEVEAGTYTQVRLGIKEANAIIDGNSFALKVPSEKIKIQGVFTIDENGVTVATIDFNAVKSLKETGEGMKILTPVIKLTVVKNAEVEIDEETEEVEVEGGEVEEETEYEHEDETEDEEEIEDENIAQGTGQLIATIKDKKVELEDINALNITIDELAVHLKDTDENSDSWTVLSSEEKTFDLKQLENTEQLLADANIASGIYTQIRLSIKEATIVIATESDSNSDLNSDTNSDSNSMDSNSTDSNSSNGTTYNTYEVKVPSGKLKIVATVRVDANSTSYMNLDFDLEKSITVTGTNTYILKPTIKVLTKKNVSVSIGDDNSVEIEGGETVDEEEAGFDEEGNETESE